MAYTHNALRNIEKRTHRNPKPSIIYTEHVRVWFLMVDDGYPDTPEQTFPEGRRSCIYLLLAEPCARKQDRTHGIVSSNTRRLALNPKR